ncbi:hypothetical protein KA013_03400 [Patescibacteria group bacterium]|nr:hypothetical protein [Patescibacteria group bacterium]
MYATEIDQKNDYTVFELHSGKKEHKITSKLVGKFNVANMMAAR